MWSNALKFIVDMYKEAKSSTDDRCAYATTVTRLRQSPKTESIWTDNTTRQQEHKASLYGALRPSYAAHLPERKAVGHWFQMTVPNARDKQMKQAVRSYEADFRPALGMEDAPFEQFLTCTAKKKALEHYILSAQSKQSSRNNVAATTDSYSIANPSFSVNTNEDAQSQDDYAADFDGFKEPDELLIRQAQDEDASVRSSVARNENAPIAVFWLLSDDENTQVKQALIANTKCPLAILEKLTRDFDARISRKAQFRLRAVLSQDVGIASGNLCSDDVEEQLETKQLEVLAA